jgi:hypothetical protein
VRAQLTLRRLRPSRENAALVSYAEQRRWSSIVIVPTKRRHLFYYLSLPLVVALVFFLVARLADLQRAEVVAELADQLAHQDTPQAAAALRQLATMPRPPVDILVGAATSADPEIAHEAQLLVSSLLRRWQHRIESDRGMAGVARQLAELAAALDKYQAAFSSGDHPWLRKTAQKIMRLANRIPSTKAPLVAAHCDAVLAGVASREQLLAAVVNRDLAATRPPAITKTAAPAELLLEKQSPPTNALRNPVSSVTSPFAASGDAVPSDVAESDRAEPMDLTPLIDSPSLPEAVNHSNRSPDWQYPGLDATPAMPIDGASTRGSNGSEQVPPTTRIVDDDGARLPSRPLEGVSNRELLRRWLVADGGEVLPFEAELTHRGFVRLSARLVAPLFSKSAEERLRLVDDVLTEPGIDPRPWLILLSEDIDADVRLLAVTIMATSDDANLIEKAWQVSIHDRDPRIAGLASRLRQRRDTAQRR